MTIPSVPGCSRRWTHGSWSPILQRCHRRRSNSDTQFSIRVLSPAVMPVPPLLREMQFVAVEAALRLMPTPAFDSTTTLRMCWPPIPFSALSCTRHPSATEPLLAKYA